MSSQNLSITTDRCRGGRPISAASSAIRSSEVRVASAGGGSGTAPVNCSATRRLRNRLRFAFTITRRT